MTIKAIETVYNGYRFRSRLEARWAVFFDVMGFEYWYELEGFNFDGLLYLPDFYLPRVKMWAEVKPEPFNADEINKAQLLTRHTGQPVLMLVGPPEMKNYWAWSYSAWANGPGNPGFCTCDYILSHYHSYYTDERRFYAATGLDENDPPDQSVLDMCEDMESAIVAARQARFEHGQSGA